MNWLFLHALFSGLASLLLAAAFLVLAQEAPLRHARYWVGAYLLLALAMLALGVEASQADPNPGLAALAASVFAVSGLAIAHAGVREWRGLPPQLGMLATLALTFCLLSALLYAFPPGFARLVSAMALLGIAALSLSSLYCVLQTKQPRNAGHHLAVAFWLVMALTVAVSLLVLLWPLPGAATRHPSPPLSSGAATYGLVFAFPVGFLGAGIFLLVAMLLERVEELRQAGVRDAVTGLYNRHGFTELAAQMYRAALRNRQPLSLMVCDIDNFKILNQSFGADAGDRALVAFAEALTDNTRQSDLVARFGGEAFVLLMAGTSHEAARHVSERIRHQLEDTEVKAPGGERFSMTASFGLTERDGAGEGDSLDAMFKRADFALYKSKADGRNRVTAVTAVDT